MDTIRRLLLNLFGIVVSIGTSSLVMINGWGIEPKSWLWIIGVYTIGTFFATLLIVASTSKS